MATHRLWTPIANALEAYRRRVVIEPTAEYEHIWRLIHIQEALAVSLASLMATRLAHVVHDPFDAKLSAMRSALTGVRPDAEGADDDDIDPSPWGGSIGGWIELLRGFGETALRDDDPFLLALATYLSSTPNRSLAFGDAWARIAPVPGTFREPSLNRVGRLGAINSFRNKLAHVPIPQRLLADIHRGLRVEVLDGLTEKFNPERDVAAPGFVATSYREPLVGVLYYGKTFLTGANEIGVDQNRIVTATAVEAAFGTDADAVRWSVDPFIRIDGEAKASLLFRVNDLRREPGATGYDGEYHRFAAELEPVTYAPVPGEVIAAWIPRSSPQPAIQPSPAPIQGVQLPVEAAESRRLIVPAQGIPSKSRQLRHKAEAAFAQRDYPTAVNHFEALAGLGETPEYNDVAQSKHGAALWRAAERASDDRSLRECLERAVELLAGAERHRDPRYSARSAYEASKALWHLWRHTGERDSLRQALGAAERAVSRSPQEAFISWEARVRSDAAREFPQGI